MPVILGTDFSIPLVVVSYIKEQSDQSTKFFLSVHIFMSSLSVFSKNGKINIHIGTSVRNPIFLRTMNPGDTFISVYVDHFC